MKMPALKSGYLYLLLFAKDDIANQNFYYLYLLLLSKYENENMRMQAVMFG